MCGVWLSFEYSACLISNFLCLCESFSLINLCISMFFLCVLDGEFSQPLPGESTPPNMAGSKQHCAQALLLKAGDTLLPQSSAGSAALRTGPVGKGRERCWAGGGTGAGNPPPALLLSHLAKETLFSYSLEPTNGATGAFCESKSWLITETGLAIPLGRHFAQNPQ